MINSVKREMLSKVTAQVSGCVFNNVNYIVWKKVSNDINIEVSSLLDIAELHKAITIKSKINKATKPFSGGEINED
jgi:GH43 family beta-xylosidase